MNKRIYDILDFNKKFVENEEYVEYQTTKTPTKKMVILSCMDTRLVELLPKAMNVKNGDVKIVKNAGATIMHPFGSIMRSILVAIYEFKAEDVIVVGHHGCGMSNLVPEDMIKKIEDRGISKEVLDTLNHAGIDLDKWLKGFSSVEESVKESVKAIKQHPLMPKDINIHGFIMSPETGKIDVVVDGYQR